MKAADEALLSPEEYLEMERDAETKSEYHDGEIVAMAGGTGPHSNLAMRLGSELTQRLKGRPCTVFNSDMKVWIESTRRFLYPDLSGLCGEPAYRDGTGDVLTNPTFVVEVLSPKTEAYDRGTKLALYMALGSISEIVLVSQEEARVDKFTRQGDGIWAFAVHPGMNATVHFESVQCEVPLRDFYEGVKLSAPSRPLVKRRSED